MGVSTRGWPGTCSSPPARPMAPCGPRSVTAACRAFRNSEMCPRDVGDVKAGHAGCLIGATAPVSVSIDCGEQKGSLGSLDAAGDGRGSQAGRDPKNLVSREVVGHEVDERAVTFEFYLCLTPSCGSGLHLDTAACDGLPALSIAQLSVRIGPASGELAERDAFVSIG
jgi:hypothetical protein